MIISSPECNTWFTVFLIESVAVVAVNLLSIILFMKNRNLRTRAMFLVINLTIADMLVGGFSSIPLFKLLGLGCDIVNISLTKKGYNITFFFFYWFLLSSITSIAAISLDRLHATFRPLRHRVIKEWVYGVTIAGVWVLTAIISTAIRIVGLLGEEGSHSFYLWQSYNCLCLFFICVSYASIVVKCLYGTHPQHQGAASRQRKLTVTLFIMTIVSLMMWLPYVIATFVYYKTTRMESYQTKLRVQYSLLVFLHINSLANPIVHTVRMPRFRKALLTLFNCRQKQNVAIIPLRAR